MTIFILLNGMKPQEVFHSLQRAKKHAREHNLQRNGRIVEVEVMAGLFFPLFQLRNTYVFTTNWVHKNQDQ